MSARRVNAKSIVLLAKNQISLPFLSSAEKSIFILPIYMYYYTCLMYWITSVISFVTLHYQSARATPNQMLKYKLSIQLYKTFNNQQPPLEWAVLNWNICTNRRQTLFETIYISFIRIANNFLSNRFKRY